MKIAFAFIAVTLHVATATASEPTLDHARLKRVPIRMQEFVNDGKIAGAVVLVTRRARVVLLESVGYQDLESKKPMRTDAVFCVASVAKPITAIGAMILQEEGRLAMEDHVQRYIPEFGDVTVYENAKVPSPLTVRHLMTHSSGIANHWNHNFLESLKKPLADVVATYAQMPLYFEPGTKSVYSSEGFDTLGRIIEVASGKNFEQFMEERVFSRLGMKDSGYFFSQDRTERLPSLYQLERGKLIESTEQDAERVRLLQHKARRFSAPAWGLHSTASDLGALLRMMLSGGKYDGHQVLSRSTVNAMTTNQVPDELKKVRGLGWYIGESSSNIRGRFYGHEGRTGVSVRVFPEQDLAVVFLIHQSGEESRHVRDVILAMVGEAVVE